MTEATEIFYGLSSKGRLDTFVKSIDEGLLEGADANVLDDWFAEAKVESARLAGENALAEGRETVVIDGLEVPSAFSALVRQIENVTAEQVNDIAKFFSTERDFTGAMDAMMGGEESDPRIVQLQTQWREVMPRTDLHGLREGSVLES